MREIDDSELTAHPTGAKMDDNSYAVILHYDPDSKETRDKIVACLSHLDPTVSSRLENLKTTGRLIVKRRADLETANRLKRLLSGTGARCSVHKLGAPQSGSDIKNRGLDKDRPAAGRQAAGLLIKCPNCGYQQPPAMECRACRIIIAKARPRTATDPNEARKAAKPPVRYWTKEQFFDRLHRYSGPLEALIKKIQNPMGVRRLTTWAQRALDRLIRCAIVFAIALVLEIGLLILGKMMWSLYVATDAGRYYLEKLPEKAQMFHSIALADAWTLGWNTTLTVLLVCLLLGGAAQFLHLVRYLYESQGVIGKLALWFGPCVGLTGWIVSQQHPFPEYALAATLVAAPTLCMLSSCLYLARTIVPEIGEFRKIVALIATNREKTWGAIAKKIRIWLNVTK